MVRKLTVLTALVVALVLAFSQAAMAQEGNVISNELEGTITVQTQSLEGSFKETGRYGTHNGVIYKEFELLYGDQRVSLSVGDVTSISVSGPDGTKTLTPNADQTLWFNVTKPAGNYVFTVVTADGTTQYTATLAWTPMQLLNIGWNLPASKTVNAGEEFDIVSTAKLTEAIANAGINAVENVLYIIEVGGAALGDFTITKVNDGDTQGINDTFVSSNGKLVGYWGPSTGFTFDPSMYDEPNSPDSQVTTTFTAKFNKAGTYTVKVYAIQVAK